MQITDSSDLEYDVLIIGGGPAGLSAALQLGRSLRSVLVSSGAPPFIPSAVSDGYAIGTTVNMELSEEELEGGQ